MLSIAALCYVGCVAIRPHTTSPTLRRLRPQLEYVAHLNLDARIASDVLEAGALHSELGAEQSCGRSSPLSSAT